MKKPKLTKEQKKLGYNYKWCKGYWADEDDGGGWEPAHWYLVDKEGNTPIRTALDSTQNMKGRKGIGAIFIQKEIDKIIKKLE